jgi:hypothetical protein
MGNRRHSARDDTGAAKVSANTVSAAGPKRAATSPTGQRGNGSKPSAWCRGADLDAYIRELTAAAPPLTVEQRDTLALLLRRPRRR